MGVIRPDDDYFVNTADLSLRRPPPDQRTGLRELLRQDLSQRILGGVFIFLVILLWPSIRQQLVEVNLLSTDSNFSEGVALGLLVSVPFALLVFFSGIRDNIRHRIPFYRNIIFVRDIIQVIFLLLFISVAY
ncbi:MAG: hypothetical protein CUN55_14980, partial [Phototrophicales bacterium]